MNSILYSWLSVITGLFVGSFLNVVADRLPAGESILRPPSHCPNCQRQLTPWELIPVLSWLALRGRCRTCYAAIPWRVPLVELATGILFGLVWLRFGWSWNLIAGIGLVCLLVPLTLIDLQHRLLLNVLVYPGMVFFALLSPRLAGFPLWPLLAGLGAFGFFLTVHLIAPRGMGMGDVKLAGMIGLALGLPETFVALFLGIILGGVISLVLLGTGLKSRKDYVPFGPFLAAGALLALLWGPEIWQFYLHILF
ncbi:MAG: prepilin peptidase [Chloroflexi bacterium]|nr:prepilin peptidase [Chloroflexota bacterium]